MTMITVCFDVVEADIPYITSTVQHCLSVVMRVRPFTDCILVMLNKLKWWCIYRFIWQLSMLYLLSITILCTMRSIAKSSVSNRQDNYFILLILTDGIITDMPQTCEAIVEVCRLLDILDLNNLLLTHTIFQNYFCYLLDKLKKLQQRWLFSYTFSKSI